MKNVALQLLIKILLKENNKMARHVIENNSLKNKKKFP